MHKIDLDNVTLRCWHVLKEYLRSWNAEHVGSQRFDWIKFHSILQTQDSKYSLKTTGKMGNDEQSLDFTIIGFAPGDGTGSRADYNIKGVKENHTPRKKIGFADIFLSLGTLYNGLFIPNLCCLEALTLKDGKVEPYANLTTDLNTFAEALNYFREPGMLPVSVKTSDVIFLQESYGNPHAIIYPADLLDNSMQFGVFVPLEDNKLGKDLIQYSKTSPPKQIHR